LRLVDVASDVLGGTLAASALGRLPGADQS
jgi:hypothetical protein